MVNLYHTRFHVVIIILLCYNVKLAFLDLLSVKVESAKLHFQGRKSLDGRQKRRDEDGCGLCGLITFTRLYKTVGTPF